jgi:hypothetical protein
MEVRLTLVMARVRRYWLREYTRVQIAQSRSFLVVGVSLAHSCTPEQSHDQFDYAGQEGDGRFSSAETAQGSSSRQRGGTVLCAPPPGNGFRRVAAVTPCQ